MKERKDPSGNVLPIGILWVKSRDKYSVTTKDGDRVAYSIEQATEMKAEFDAYVASHPEWISRHQTEHSKKIKAVYQKSDAGHKTYNKWAKSTGGKAVLLRRSRNQAKKGNRLKLQQTPKGRATQKRAYDKKMADPGKKLHARIGTRLSVAVGGGDNSDSIRLTEWTAFKNSAEIATHFESTFDRSWMTMQNYGAHARNKPRTWNIGHRIPLSMFGSSKADMHRCWSKANLFAQCSKENNQNLDRMPPKDVLVPLKDVWPLAWLGCLPTAAV